MTAGAPSNGLLLESQACYFAFWFVMSWEVNLKLKGLGQCLQAHFAGVSIVVIAYRCVYVCGINLLPGDWIHEI